MKRRIRFIYLLFSLIEMFVFTNNGFCQSSLQAKRDSLHNKFVMDSARIYRPKKVALVLATDKRNSFIKTNTKTPVSVSGFQIGVELYEKHSFGLGFYTVLNTQQVHPVVDDLQKIIQPSFMSIFLWTENIGR